MFASMPMKKSSFVGNELPTREILGHEVRYIEVSVHVYKLDRCIINELTHKVDLECQVLRFIGRLVVGDHIHGCSAVGEQLSGFMLVKSQTC